MKKRFSLHLFSVLAILFAFSSVQIEAQSQSETKKPIKYKKARALQTSTAKKMAKVYAVSYTHLTLPTIRWV